MEYVMSEEGNVWVYACPLISIIMLISYTQHIMTRYQEHI